MRIIREIGKFAAVWMTAGALLLTGVPAQAAEADGPSAGTMAADALVARPIGLVLTTLGVATFVVSLPFSALGGNVDKAAQSLVVKPAQATFVRCLGCRSTGVSLERSALERANDSRMHELRDVASE